MKTFRFSNFPLYPEAEPRGILLIKYSISPDLKLSASIINLGKISWKTNLHTLNLNGSYDFRNEDIDVDQLTGIISKTDDEISFVDEISEIFDISDANEVVYEGSLPTSFYVGLHYKMNEQLNVGLVNRFIKYKKLTYNSLSINANYKLNKRFTAVSGMAIHGDSYLNIPLGILYKWNGGQAYCSTDNLMPLVVSNSSDFQGFSAGAVFYLFRPKMKYERFEHLPFYRHKKTRKTESDGLLFKGYKKK